jgi:hypothetical protein
MIKDVLFFIIEFKGKEDLDQFLFSEILFTSKRCNPNPKKSKNAVIRPKIFIECINNSCIQELIDEIDYLIKFKKVILFAIEGASKVVHEVLKHFDNNVHSKNIIAYFINSGDLNAYLNIKTRFYFSDCGDEQSANKKKCISEKEISETKYKKNIYNVEWVSIKESNLMYGYSITILRQIINNNYLHAF